MSYGRAAIVVQYSEQSDYSVPLLQNFTSGFTMPSTTSVVIAIRDTAPSGGFAVTTSTLTSAYGTFIANRGTTNGLHVSCTTPSGACNIAISAGRFAFIPDILAASNLTISGASGTAGSEFEFLAIGT